MVITDLFQETIWSVLRNKVRSGLTVLGIVIGIASVITMVAIGQGSKASIQSSIESIGSNLIMVMPGSQKGMVSQGRGSAQTLKMSDMEAIRDQIQGLKAIAPQVTGSYQIIAGGNNTNTQVIGTTTDYATARNVSISTGSFFNEQQNKSGAKVAVLGSTTSEDLFGTDADPIGKTVRINGIEFKVIGVTVAKGGTGQSSSDDSVYVPINTALNYLANNDYINGIVMTAESQDEMTSIQEQITQLLLSRHGIASSDDADFSIMNQNDILETASSVTGTLTIMLASIAGISLLVGGIGIMNMMLTTVTERTREIGLRKAVGMDKLYISLQFLSEAVVLTFSGGVIGIILGFVASWAVTKFAGTATQVSMGSIWLAFGVSAAVGIIFGFYPARRAANLSPMEALRYE